MTVRDIFSLACPRCNGDEHLQIQVGTMADLYPDGSETCGDQTWDDDSFIRCRACNQTGTVKDFAIKEARP